MPGTGRIYQRGDIYFVAYSIVGREFRESTRSREWGAAQALLERRLREQEAAVQRVADAPRCTFADIAHAYIDEYAIRGLRTLSTARLRVAHLTAFFGGMAAAAITAPVIRRYQAARRAQGAAAGTINRETAALHRMCTLAERSGTLPRRVMFRNAFAKARRGKASLNIRTISPSAPTCLRHFKTCSILPTTPAGASKRSCS